MLHSFYILFLHLQRESFSEQYLITFSKFLPSHSCFCSYCCFTSFTGIQPIAKIAKSLHSFHFITHYLLLHFAHTICRFITFITYKKSCCTWSYFLNLQHLPRTHWSHFIHDTDLTVTLLPHIPHRSILLCMTSPSDSHTITFVFSRFTFRPVLLNALLHFSNLSFRPSIVSLISTKPSVYKTSFMKAFLAFSVTSIIIANNKGDKTDP